MRHKAKKDAVPMLRVYKLRAAYDPKKIIVLDFTEDFFFEIFP